MSGDQVRYRHHDMWKMVGEIPIHGAEAARLRVMATIADRLADVVDILEDIADELEVKNNGK